MMIENIHFITSIKKTQKKDENWNQFEFCPINPKISIWKQKQHHKSIGQDEI